MKKYQVLSDTFDSVIYLVESYGNNISKNLLLDDCVGIEEPQETLDKAIKIIKEETKKDFETNSHWFYFVKEIEE